MSTIRLIFVVIGTVFMFLLMLFRRSVYTEITWKQTVICCIAVSLFGVPGSMLLSYIEYGSWGGSLFYGAFLTVSVLMLPFSKLIKIPYGRLMDFCGFGGLLIFAMIKLDCLRCGCCPGRYFMALNGNRIQFPSELIEMACGLLVVILLVKLERNPKYQNKIYAFYLFLHGCCQLVLNHFREDLSPYFGFVPSIDIWACLCILSGLTIVAIQERNKQPASQSKQF